MNRKAVIEIMQNACCKWWCIYTSHANFADEWWSHGTLLNETPISSAEWRRDVLITCWCLDISAQQSLLNDLYYACGMGASQWHEMNCYELEVMSSSPDRAELGVRGTSALSRTWTKHILNLLCVFSSTTTTTTIDSTATTNATTAAATSTSTDTA